MRISTHHKLFIVVFGILLLTIFTYNINKLFVPTSVEGMDNFMDPNYWKDLIRKGEEAVTNQANSVINSIISGIMSVVQPIIDFWAQTEARFENIKNGSVDIGNGILAEMDATKYLFNTATNDIGNVLSDIDYIYPYVGAALEMESANIGEAIKQSDDDLTAFFNSLEKVFDPYLVDSANKDGLFDRLFKAANMYLECGIKKVKHLRSCLFLYFINMVGVMFYSLFISYPIWLVKRVTGVDISGPINYIFVGMDDIDRMCMSYTGYNLFQYSPSILEKCYYCDGVPHKGIYDNRLNPEPNQPIVQAPPFPKEITNSINQISVDWNTTNGQIPMRLQEMGKFLGNDTKDVPEWVIAKGIDPTVASNFNTASANLNHFNIDSNQLITDFNVNIPNAFKHTEDSIYKGAAKLKAALS